MPDRVYLFDVDGTLTHPLTEVDDVFAEVFLSWVRDKKKKALKAPSFRLKKFLAGKTEGFNSSMTDVKKPIARS